MVDNDDGPGTFMFQSKAATRSLENNASRFLSRIAGQFLVRTATMLRSRSVSRFRSRIAEVVTDAQSFKGGALGFFNCPERVLLVFRLESLEKPSKFQC